MAGRTWKRPRCSLHHYQCQHVAIAGPVRRCLNIIHQLRLPWAITIAFVLLKHCMYFVIMKTRDCNCRLLQILGFGALFKFRNSLREIKRYLCTYLNMNSCSTVLCGNIIYQKDLDQVFKCSESFQYGTHCLRRQQSSQVTNNTQTIRTIVFFCY